MSKSNQKKQFLVIEGRADVGNGVFSAPVGGRIPLKDSVAGPLGRAIELADLFDLEPGDGGLDIVGTSVARVRLPWQREGTQVRAILELELKVVTE